jgi:hypothetical protein
LPSSSPSLPSLARHPRHHCHEYHILQAQIHFTTNTHTSWHSSQSNRWSNLCIERNKEYTWNATNWKIKMIDKLLNKIPSNLTDMSDPFNKSNTSKGGRHQTRTNTTNLSIPSSKHRRHTKTDIGASSKGAKRK